MSFEPDEEILQDFLVEAGEILELLSEQLVELEQNPEDKELLNAIFRGFHTVKGGAGFLQLEALVDCCHVSENVFDLLRNGQLSVSTELMDVVLLALDAINEMFDQVKQREEPTPAEPSIIAGLVAFVNGDAGTEEAAPASEEASIAAEADQQAEVTEPTAADSQNEQVGQPEPCDDISDEEFENFLNALDEPEPADDQQATAVKVEAKQNTRDSTKEGKDDAAATSGSEDISEDEFEALLDQLHGEGKFGGAVADNEVTSAQQGETNAKNGDNSTTSSSTQPTSTTKKTAASNSEDITDDEFESLLDELHGKGKFDAGTVNQSVPAPAKTEAATEAETNSAPAQTSGKQPSAPQKAQNNVKPISEAKAAAANKPAQPPQPAAPKKAAARDQSATIATETTVRVDTRRLDDIMNMVGELVLVRNRLKRLGEEIASENMTKAVSNLDIVTSDLQSAVMQTRMQPIKKVFGRFPRVVRDLARNLKKEVNLILRGEDTDLDKNLVEALSDPLVHLVRNAVDHGVESPEVREKNGKPRVGRVVLSAEQEGDHILLSIEDDGAGMNADVLRGIAVEKGLYDTDAAERLSDQEAFALIFAAGFSTKKEISDVSGRGVGMDVVKTKITQLNGTLQVDSVLGKGSTIIIKVPLTLAIMPTLMVMLSEQAFAFPLVSVVEIFHLDLTKTNIVDGQECIVVRENVYPVFHIKRWLVDGSEFELSSRNGHVVIVSVGNKRVGLVVDQLVGQEEVVIKPLGRMLTGTPGMAGATITGDGRIALILDIPTLLTHYSPTSKVYGRPHFHEDSEPEESTDPTESAAYGS